MSGISETRAQATAIFHAGVAAADPGAGVIAALRVRPAAPGLVLSIGKAGRSMAAAAMSAIPAPARVLVVTNYENAAPLAGAEVLAAGHPVPDAAGLAAARAVEQAVTGGQGPILALISGGGSALLPAPVAGVSLADKAETSRILLGAGLDIGAMNLVRQQLSRLKGGGLARLALAHGRALRTLVLSDVVGDDLRVIASGPTTAPLGTTAQARALLRGQGVWDRLPEPVRAHLQSAPERPDPPEADAEVVGSNRLSVAAMARAAPGATVIANPLVGDVAAAAARVLAEAGPGITLWGGETTVRLAGDGLGGRNQELALRVALAAEGCGLEPFVFLSGGTDGRDGPTDAAGGLVDAGTLARMRAAGHHPCDVLARNDSYHGLGAAGDLLRLPATGTNVADLQIMIRL